MKISINRQHVNKDPDPTPEGWWGWFNGQFENEECDATDVLMYAHYGWAYTSQHSDYRKADNFICGQHIDLDMDNGAYTLPGLLADEFISRYASFIYATATSSPDHPRFRVFFELDRPIYDASKYRLLRDALLHKYPSADKSHRDVCRLAFGSFDCDYHYMGNVLTLEVAASELVKPYQLDTLQTREGGEKPLNASQTAHNDASQPFLKAKRDYLLHKVETAPEGEKWYTLRKVAFTFGGLVAEKYYDESEIRYLLADAIRNNPNRIKSPEIADKCIDEMLEMGQARPLTIAGQYRQPGQGQ